LRRDEISLTAAIVAVVDSFDAMTEDRVYRRGRPKADALAEIAAHRGSLFHPHVVDAFLGIADTIT
jgi:HD-GYP domain-containing protein (c-di-GMP phosphodiesterase class II)